MSDNPDPRVGEIEARLSAATPGPWEYDGDGVTQSYDLAVRTGEHTLELVGIILGEYVRSNDAEFIANAPADVAYLLAELRKAREALGRVEEVAARLHWEADNANEGAKYAAEVNQGASLMALESERFAYQKAEHLIRAAVAAANGDGE